MQLYGITVVIYLAGISMKKFQVVFSMDILKVSEFMVFFGGSHLVSGCFIEVYQGIYL